MMMLGLIIAVGAMAVAVELLRKAIQRLRTEVRSLHVDHAACLGHVAKYVGDAKAADVLRAAATAWDSAEEQGVLNRLARTEYQAGGPSMPTIWLNRRADEYNLAGERFTTDD